MGGLTRSEPDHAMESNAEQKSRRVVRLRHINLILGLFAALLAVILVFTTVYTLNSYRAAVEASERLYRAQQITAAMQAGSDYLTDRARTFAVTGDAQAADDYVREIEVTRRRELALSDMEQLLSDAETMRLMDEALRLSNELAEIECYAMRLAIEANGGDYAPLLQNAVLEDADLALSKDAQIEKARTLLFDEVYQNYRSAIRANISECENKLLGYTRQAQADTILHLGRMLVLQAVLTTILLLTVIAVILCTRWLILLPLRTVSRGIPTGNVIPEVGAYELQYLIRAYNEAHAQSQEQQERMAYEVTHDHLTGLSNRAVFDEQRVNPHRRRCCMLLIDVDSFKQINDTYGHDMGDRVLKKVADTLRRSFRSEDWVCRIGGDEFAVIMPHTDRSLRGMIERKLDRIMEQLKDTSDGLPTITLCIGVAFCDPENRTDDLYKDADAAMYVVKERGKNGYAFFEDK